ncbi:MAG: hypothetical protein K0S56_1673 [Microvirga sp.]|jgi:hypothetical protein|nr:hypothetical protein [Microvirga sp.]
MISRIIDLSDAKWTGDVEKVKQYMELMATALPQLIQARKRPDANR